MKYFIKVALLFAVVFYSGCSTKSVKKPVLTKTHINIDGITAPRKIGEYELQSQKCYENKNLGIALRYANNKSKNAFLDCFVYPRGSDKDLQTHYDSFMSALKFMSKKGEFKSFEIIKEDEVMLDSSTKAKRALFRITNKSLPYYSVAYIAEVDNHFFKVRISNQLVDSFLSSDLGWDATKKLFQTVKLSK
jgi:hypothetical protein